MYQENPIALLEQVLETFTVLDAQGVVRSQSPWFERILGYKQGALTGNSVFSYIHPDDRPPVVDAFMMIARTPGATTAAEFRFQHRDGSWQVLQAAGKSIVDSSGEIRVVISARNVTERKRAEEALRESEEKYRDFVENVNDVIYAHDEKGILSYISPVIETFGGYRPGDIIGRPFSEFVYPADLPMVLESFHRTLAGQLEPSEFRAVAKSGEIRWVRSSSRPIVKEGRVVGLQGVLTDITARKRAEQRTTTLLEISRDISGTLDLQELLSRVERRMAEALPCRAVATLFWEPFAGLFRLMSHYECDVVSLPPPDHLSFPAEELYRRVAEGKTFTAQSGQGSLRKLPRWFLEQGPTTMLVAPLLVRERLRGVLLARAALHEKAFDPEQIALWDGVARQLAVGIEAAELFQTQQEETLISSALARVGQELIASLDTPAILARLSLLAVELLGGADSAVVLWQPVEENVFHALIKNPSAQEAPESFRSLKLARTTVADLTKRFSEEDAVELTPLELGRHGLGDLFPSQDLTASLCLALRQGKDLIGVQVVGYKHRYELEQRRKRIARGITQIASLALANAQLLSELEHANQLKQDFVGTMSHELRTPLNVILGYNELMREGAFGVLSSEQIDILERMNKSATQLLDLINSTLDLSRIQSQSTPLALTTVSIGELFAELESDLRPLQGKSAVALEWRLEPGLPLLRTDPVKLKMVLKNLVGNALKFTDEGEVFTVASLQGDGVEFMVRDSGIGIPLEAHALIFEPFRQVDGSMTRRHGGVGLGLYIVRQLLELLGGTISLESEVGKGSTFRVWIPNKEPQRRGSAP